MKSCNDKNCPFHGSLRVKKRTLTGVVSSTKMRRTVDVKRELRVMLKKYDRFAKRYSSIKAHLPDCIEVKESEIVTVAACRPLSKSKHFVVISKRKKEE
ncbi:30S ribosomal protein S17 [Candidatus Woesearchaeota archaeon]|nr:30S ribosomal protein S17 [Candidatus Woesearchaeota archaeon]